MNKKHPPMYARTHTPIARFQLRILQDEMKPSNANVGSQGAHCYKAESRSRIEKKKRGNSISIPHPDLYPVRGVAFT